MKNRDKEIWVVVEQGRDDQDDLQEVSLEALIEGQRVAQKIGATLGAVIMSEGAGKKLIETLAQYGAKRVYALEHPLLAKYTADAFVTALTALIKEYIPEVVLLGATPQGKDLAPRVAARLRVGLVTDCTMLALDEQGGLQAVRPIYGGKVYAYVAWRAEKPYMATIKPGAIGVGKPLRSPAEVELIEVKPQIAPEEVRTRPVGFIKADPRTVDLTEAEVVVAGGRGVGGRGKWHIIEELAEALGGSVGGTRAAVDQGCITDARLIGVTGKTVKPRLYVAAGISGASQHLNGIGDARVVVAINLDRGAPIFRVADLPVVGDLHQVIPALIKKIRQVDQSAATQRKDGNG